MSYDDFGDCHDEIVVVGVDFIGHAANLWALSVRGGVLLDL